MAKKAASKAGAKTTTKTTKASTAKADTTKASTSKASTAKAAEPKVIVTLGQTESGQAFVSKIENPHNVPLPPFGVVAVLDRGHTKLAGASITPHLGVAPFMGVTLLEAGSNYKGLVIMSINGFTIEVVMGEGFVVSTAAAELFARKADNKNIKENGKKTADLKLVTSDDSPEDEIEEDEFEEESEAESEEEEFEEDESEEEEFEEDESEEEFESEDESEEEEFEEDESEEESEDESEDESEEEEFEEEEEEGEELTEEEIEQYLKQVKSAKKIGTLIKIGAELGEAFTNKTPVAKARKILLEILMGAEDDGE